MGNEETLSKKEIIDLIEEGDRYTGARLEDIDDKIKTVMEMHETLERKIDELEIRVDARFSDIDSQLRLLFEDNQRFFDELRSMRKDFKEFYKRFDILAHDFYGQRKT